MKIKVIVQNENDWTFALLDYGNGRKGFAVF
jgi:hypothetical protein